MLGRNFMCNKVYGRAFRFFELENKQDCWIGNEAGAETAKLSHALPPRVDIVEHKVVSSTVYHSGLKRVLSWDKYNKG